MSDPVNGPLQPPAPRPCQSCPYRRDVPSGIWAADQYDKLPGYDRDLPLQPAGMFLCHQTDGRICAGWVGCHDMRNNLAVRMASLREDLDAETLDAVLDYMTPVALFPSGTQAAEHGKRDLLVPDGRAQQAISKIVRRRPDVGYG